MAFVLRSMFLLNQCRIVLAMGVISDNLKIRP